MSANRPEAVQREAAEQAAANPADPDAVDGGFMDKDGDGIADSRDATPNENNTDPASPDVGDGPEANPGYSSDPSSGYDGGSDSDPASTDASADSDSVSGDMGDTGGYGDTGAGADTSGDRDGDGISDSSDATPNQNDTDPTSTDVGDGPEGNLGY